MTKANRNNENETKSDIFPWDIFKADAISFFIKKLTFKIKICQFFD